jgi:predicted GNAT superfamily acetyltransferase
MDIRRLTALAEMAPVVELQVAIWGADQTVPSHELLIHARTGGLLLAAYDGRGDFVGFSYAFPAWQPGGEPWLHSQMLAVREDVRSRGAGFALKLAQRQHALAMGYRRITWTYDPLLGPNAHLNIARLGGVARHYERDVYGAMSDALNAGLPSDRLLVEWELDSARVRARLTQPARPAPSEAVGAVAADPAAQAPCVTSLHQDGPLPRIAAVDLGRGEPELRVAIPGDFPAMKAADMGLAADWRARTREVLEHYFAAGYAIVGFARGGSVHHYLLRAGGDPFAR